MNFANMNRTAVSGGVAGSSGPYDAMMAPPLAPPSNFVPFHVTLYGYPAYIDSPAGALRAMSKDGSTTCDWWRTLTWSQKLVQAGNVVNANSRYIRSVPVPLPSGGVDQDAATVAHAIDAYCLGQGIAGVNQYVTKTTIKGSGAAGDPEPMNPVVTFLAGAAAAWVAMKVFGPKL